MSVHFWKSSFLLYYEFHSRRPWCSHLYINIRNCKYTIIQWVKPMRLEIGNGLSCLPSAMCTFCAHGMRAPWSGRTSFILWIFYFSNTLEYNSRNRYYYKYFICGRYKSRPLCLFMHSPNNYNFTRFTYTCNYCNYF